ncbi:MAG: P-II family nitrogen regulator [Pseudomonadota bacterium]
MKMIVAVIRPHALDALRGELASLGVQGMTVVEAKGYGRQQGHTEIYRGAEYQIDFVPKIRMEIVVEDQLLDAVLEKIVASTRTGKIGDGKVFVMPVEDALRVRTGEQGQEAL